MLFNPDKFIKMSEEKFTAFAELTNRKFNELNNLSPMSFSNNVRTLHYLIGRGEPFNRDLFTKEEFDQRELLEAAESERASKLVNGEIKPYHVTYEDLKILTMTIEELVEATMSEEEHKELLKKQIGG